MKSWNSPIKNPHNIKRCNVHFAEMMSTATAVKIYHSSCFCEAENMDSLLALVSCHYSWIQQDYSEGINYNYTSRRVLAWWKEYRCKKRLFNVLGTKNLLDQICSKTRARTAAGVLSFKGSTASNIKIPSSTKYHQNIGNA